MYLLLKRIRHGFIELRTNNTRVQKVAMAGLGHEPYVVGHQGKVKESPYGMCFLLEGERRWFPRQFVTEQNSRTFTIPEWLAREAGLYLEAGAFPESANDDAA